MPINADHKNRFLSSISVAARTVLANPRNIELADFIGAGPSIRARARLALAAVFMVAAPTLFVGVMRSEHVAERAAALSEYDDYWKKILETRIAIKDLELALWEYVSEREFENGQAAIVASGQLKQIVASLILQKPVGLDIGPTGFFEGLAVRLDGLIRRSIANQSSMAPARLSVIAFSREIKNLEKNVSFIAKSERKSALGSLATVGRDQLILFLVLIFAMPVFILFVPGWLVSPLIRLRQIASKVDSGQIKEIVISGRDEVAILARTLKGLFLKRDELDQKKSSKIFEMRNILRSVLGRVDEAVFIVDENLKINYTNNAAASLVGLPPHQMEGTSMADCMYSPVCKKATEKAFEGDVSETPIPISIEVSDGRSFAMQARIGVVRNRDGEVSRAVIIISANNEDV